MRAYLPIAAVLVAGCGSEKDIVPLEVGLKSRYEVQGGPFNHFIAEAEVVRQAAVAGLDGYVIAGPMGETHVAWKGDTLVGERFSNTRFVPAIPLVVARDGQIRKHWKGTVQGFWGGFNGDAILDQGPADDAQGKKLKRVKTVLTVSDPKGRSIKLLTEYEPGIGIISQRQDVSGSLVLRIDRLSGS